MALQKACRDLRNFRVKHDIEIRVPQLRDVRGCGAHGRGHHNLNAHACEQFGDFGHIIAMPKAKGGRAQNIAARRARRITWRAGLRRPSEGAHQAIEGLRRAPIFLALICRQFKRHHGHRQAERLRQPTRIILNQLCRARSADQHGFRLEAGIGIARRFHEKLGGVAAQVARLESCPCHGRALFPPFDHGEKQISIGIALRRMQHIMHALHRGCDTHRPHMRRPFISPDGKLHGYTISFSRRTKGRAKSPARSPAWS